jgi:hypothetical protein
MKIKNKLFLVLFLLLLVSCSGASNSGNQKQTAPINPPTAQDVQPAPVTIPEPIPTPVPAPVPEPEPEPEPISPFPLTFETPIHDHDESRIKNIKIAAKALTGYVLKKGEEFSFNTVVGERTTEKGYEEATIFVSGEKVDGVGGGICQISSTLYNLALLSKFEITERHVHQLPVTYVEKGKDATVAFGSLDLRFVNNSAFDVKLLVNVTKDTVSATFEKNTETPAQKK